MDTWIKDKYGKPFGTNVAVYDRASKDIVLISNGVCTLDHTSPDAYKLSHAASVGCVYAPSEAVALRVIGERKRRKRKSEPLVAWSYVGVRPENLCVVSSDRWTAPHSLAGCVGRG